MTKLRWVALAMALSLAGCQDSGVDLSAASARKVSVGASVPVAIQSIEGAPEAVSPRFSAAFTAAAQARDIVFVDAATARFKLRGYLDAFAGENGATVSWVWDVYDTKSRRAQRVSGSQALGKGASDPWGAVDDKALQFIAARSLDEIGVFLEVHRAPEGALAAGAPAPGKKVDARAEAE